MKKVKRIAALLIVNLFDRDDFCYIILCDYGESIFYGIFVYDACVTVIDLCLYVYLSNRKR